MVIEQLATDTSHENGYANGNGASNGDSEGYAPSYIARLEPDSTWESEAITIAGGNRWGNDPGRLNFPAGFYIDDDDTVYIADYSNNRIVAWKEGDKTGRVVVGEGDQSGRTERLRNPKDIIVHKATDSYIIADEGNQRVVQWPREPGLPVKTLISDCTPVSLTMDDEGNLYVCDFEKHEVRRWKLDDTSGPGTLVAGGNGKGCYLKQLSSPTCVFVDKEKSVYVSDWANHRIVKWVPGAKKGIIVAGANKSPHNPMSMSDPWGLFVDQYLNIFVADWLRQRIVRYTKDSVTECTMVAGEGGNGAKGPTQFNHPMFFKFDQKGNLYVSDFSNHRVQKFNLKQQNAITN